MRHAMCAVTRAATRRTRPIAVLVACAVMTASVTVAGVAALDGPAGAATVSAVHPADSHWTTCNDDAATSAPAVVMWRIQGATEDNHDIPADFWTNTGYRGDIAKIICYESTYYWHAENGPQYGWFQMNQPLIGSEGVSWNEYWNGTSAHEAGWYQCLAGERYILHRYGNPLAAWEHERYYGWY